MVTFDRVGFHCYPNAPEEVDYLATRHRHKFFFKVTVPVEHNERDLEFHMFLTKITGWYDSSALELNAKSCETIAEQLALKILGVYSKLHFCEVEVWEDQECGARIRIENKTVSTL